MTSASPRELYLSLLKDGLQCSFWSEHERAVLGELRNRGSASERLMFQLFKMTGFRLIKEAKPSTSESREGRIWPELAFTMIGSERLDNIRYCVEDVLKRNVPGDLIETGVWRGGATIFMRGILAAHEVTDRTVWVADSFKGLPPPDTENYPADAHFDFHTAKTLAVSLEEVKEHFSRFGLLDQQVKFLKGWFKDTLPSAPIQRLAVARLDGDMYESTIQALSVLYPKVSPGGYVIIDDYSIGACQQAVTDYRTQNNISDEIIKIDWTGIYWQKSTFCDKGNDISAMAVNNDRSNIR